MGYIYCGRLDSSDIEVLKGIYLAANMLQMADLGKPLEQLGPFELAKLPTVLIGPTRRPVIL